MWRVYDLGELITSYKENQAGPQGTGSVMSPILWKTGKWMPLNLWQIKNIKSATSWVVDEMRQEVEVGSSEEGWAHVTSDRRRFDRGCNQELMWTRGGGSLLGIRTWHRFSNRELCNPQIFMLALSSAIYVSISVLSSSKAADWLDGWRGTKVCLDEILLGDLQDPDVHGEGGATCFNLLSWPPGCRNSNQFSSPQWRQWGVGLL